MYNGIKKKDALNLFKSYSKIKLYQTQIDMQNKINYSRIYSYSRAILINNNNNNGV